MKRSKLVKPIITAAGVLALYGVGLAQTPSMSHREASARGHEGMNNACPLPKLTKDKITEDQARDLAQQFADKNWSGFKVERPLGYGGGYTTMCYQMGQNQAMQSASDADKSRIQSSRPDGNTTVGKDTDQPNQPRLRSDSASTSGNQSDQRTVYSSSARPQVLYSVEYSMDLKNSAGETRNLCVDQFGSVSEFCSSFGMAGATGPAGPMGAQGPAGPAGAQGMAGSGSGQQWSNFRDFLFDFDKSSIRSSQTSHVSDIAAYMRNNPNARVGIDGHTDPRGTDPYNQGLSERRVNNIRDALVSAGVAESRIKTGAFGESQPKCNESTEACWQADRRVEVLIGTDTASR